jgi:hypothetical protein
MAETAAHLVDHVYPAVPVRQWVVSLPKRLRYFLVRDARLLNRVVRIALTDVERAIRAHGPGARGETLLLLTPLEFLDRISSADPTTEPPPASLLWCAGVELTLGARRSRPERA